MHGSEACNVLEHRKIGIKLCSNGYFFVFCRSSDVSNSFMEEKRMKTNKSKQKQEYTLQAYKNGFRCSGTVIMINGLKERVQASASTEKEAMDKWKQRILERNEIIMYGEKKRQGNISLYNACKDMI